MGSASRSLWAKSSLLPAFVLPVARTVFMFLEGLLKKKEEKEENKRRRRRRRRMEREQEEENRRRENRRKIGRASCRERV